MQIKQNMAMKCYFTLVYLIIATLSITINSMEQKSDSWQDLPTEIKSYILLLICNRTSMAEILDNLKGCAQVNKEFRKIIKELIYNPEVYVEPNPESAYQELIYASKTGNKNVVKALINAGININTKNSFGSTLLIDTIPSANKELIKLLICSGADLNAQNICGYTALMMSPNKDISQLLLNSGADANIQDRDRDTALILAARCGSKKEIEILINNGTDPYIYNYLGQTALTLLKAP